MGKKSNGQINLEFLAAAGFYLIALGAVITAGSDILPQYSQEADQAALNLEARSLTNQLMTEPGSHNFDNGGNDWEYNSSTVQNTTSLGLASDFLELERDKINSLSTVALSGEKLNYTRFKEITGAENQYRFEFMWMPTVQTNGEFTRTRPPSNPDITEPEYSTYEDADNRIHYGEINLEGDSYKFLVTAHNGVYDTAYIEDDWDFENELPINAKESIPDAPFEVHSFQNRARKPGSLVVLNQTINTFGASTDSDSIVTTFQRFGVMEEEPLRIKVWVW